MSAFTGRQDTSGPKSERKNKGVARARQEQKRIEAEARNELTDLAKRKVIRKQIAQRFVEEPEIVETVDESSELLGIEPTKGKRDRGIPKRKKGKKQ